MSIKLLGFPGFLLPKQALYQAEPRPGPAAPRFLADWNPPDNAGPTMRARHAGGQRARDISPDIAAG